MHELGLKYDAPTHRTVQIKTDSGIFTKSVGMLAVTADVTRAVS